MLAGKFAKVPQKGFASPKFNSIQLSKPNRKFSEKNPFPALDTFERRHLGSLEEDTKKMLTTVGLTSLDELVKKTVPSGILLNKELDLPQPLSESEALRELKQIASQNLIYKSYIGMGYYNTHTPPVIQRNILENPGWYTAYTPYQAEISQGRLESLLNFQTMVCDLTGMEVSNASLLDEGTAAAEAMNMAINTCTNDSDSFFIDVNCHPQTIEVIKTRADVHKFKVVVGPLSQLNATGEKYAGVLIQYPDTNGEVKDFQHLVQSIKATGAVAVCATDLLALTLIKPPGEFGVDIAVGSAQRFGVPLGYGGPHAAFLAVKDKNLMRKMPGRIIGVSKDSRGKTALRMALQTREQHIRREKATSNICTAQALLANIAAMYAVYHGPKGLKAIADRVHNMTVVLAEALRQAGHTVSNEMFFDTLKIVPKGVSAAAIQQQALKKKINVRSFPESENAVGVSIDETTTAKDLSDLISLFLPANTSVNLGELLQKSKSPLQSSPVSRTSPYLQHPVFNSHHGEHSMLRYIKQLESKDYSLCYGMIPLGSCTMKLNATSEMFPITWPEFGGIHPFSPLDQTQGYQKMVNDLRKWLSEITGFYDVTLQPNAGSQGEFTGLLVIAEYLKSIGQGHRDICLIPESAHGTNPASAVMAGMKVVLVQCDSSGYIKMDSLKQQAELHKDKLAALMITYPSTYGVFEENVREIVDLIHKLGGQVYMDGANMNAQVGLTSPGFIGADVCHLNLHKTFCIPHGGGGPGVGPIGVAKHLAPFLPSHPVVPVVGKTGKLDKATGPVSAAPWGSASILPITWMYIRMMGAAGLTAATKVAMLNANYMKRRLQENFLIPFHNKNEMVAHEFIVDIRPLTDKSEVSAEDVAKRLMDYGFHAPTMSWPVAGTLMIEPTESESKAELDRFCDALVSIRKEIQEIEAGLADKKSNVLKGAPHTYDVVAGDSWGRPYPREKAAFPSQSARQHKFWPMVGRIDNVFGDRNPVCSCPPMDQYK